MPCFYMKCVFTVFILCIFVATFLKIGTVPIATPLIEIKFACIVILLQYPLEMFVVLLFS